MFDQDQKLEALKMMEFVAACMKEPMQRATISDDERATLKRCWHDGTESQEQYNLILAVYNRFKGIKTPEETTQSIGDWVREGRKKNGLQ